MSHLMLGVTEICNMRCRYCVYGGYYKNERIHSNRIMAVETGKYAIDFFLQESGNRELILNFYGGEPFTNFPVIKAVFEYAERKFLSVKSYITTNGTLLSRDIAEWFLQNQQPRRKRRGTVLNVSHCMFYKVVAVGFNTLCYDAERRGIKPSYNKVIELSCIIWVK